MDSARSKTPLTTPSPDAGVAGGAQAAQREGGPQGGGGLVALILGRALEAGPVEALLVVVTGQDTNPIGVPVSSATRVSPSVAAEQTYSRCGMPHRMTTPSTTTASWVRPSSAATTGSSDVLGTR